MAIFFFFLKKALGYLKEENGKKMTMEPTLFTLLKYIVTDQSFYNKSVRLSYDLK